MTSISEMSGTLRMTHSPRAKMEAAMSFSAEFFAPETAHRPSSVPLPCTMIIS